jgi:glycosyltransferase involved in cell wall biosynthesis
VFYDGHIAYNLHKELKIPYVVSFRNTDLDIFRRYSKLRECGLRILKNASKIVFISHAHYNEFINTNYYNKINVSLKNKSIVIPNGINEYWLNNIYNKNKNELRGTINILTVGWIQQNKNQINVAKAIEKIIKETDFNIVYTVIGHPREKSYMHKLKKYKFVNILSTVSNEFLLNEYRKADIFVMTSFKETFGLVFLEALTQKLPIIYTKNQGIDGFFNNKDYAYSVNPGDYKEISDAIKYIIDNNDKISYSDISDLEEFRWNNIATKLFNVYKSV